MRRQRRIWERSNSLKLESRIPFFLPLLSGRRLSPRMAQHGQLVGLRELNEMTAAWEEGKGSHSVDFMIHKRVNR